MLYEFHASKDRKKILRMELEPRCIDDEEFLMRLHKAITCNDRIQILDSEVDENGKIQILEYTSGGEPLENPFENENNKDLRTPKPIPLKVKLSRVHTVLNCIITYSFLGWCLTSFLRWCLV